MEEMRIRIAIVSILSLFGLVMVPEWNGAAAQPYPSRPIHIVAFGTSGGTDLIARLIAQNLTESFGPQAIVVNIPGAGGRIGTLHVAKSKPDGYTLLLTGSGPITFAPALYRKLAYDVQRDFQPITMVASSAYLLVVHPSVPVQSVKELISLGKAKPGALDYSSSGVGMVPHLSGELFQAMAKVKMLHIPYKGTGTALMSVISGETDFMFSNLLAAVPVVNSGRLRPVAITSSNRSPLFPKVPTVAESGLPGFEATTLYGLLAPARTPNNIIVQLNSVLVRALQSPKTRKTVEASGSEVVTSTPEDFEKFIRTDIEKWSSVVKKAGIKPE